MMNRSLVALVLAACAAVAGCSSATSADSTYAGAEPANAGTGGDRSGGATSPSPGGGAGDAKGGAPGSGSGATQQAGQLTAGVWDDNLNYEFFGKYLEQSKSMKEASLFLPGDRAAAHTRAMGPHGVKTELDVAIVLDTTSSMTDEISYLQAELQAIATAVKTKFPATTPRFGLVVYRDTGDEYLTRSFPFTSDIASFRGSLNGQGSGGGGDLPEAVPEGLADGVALDWRPAESVARLMFWVADAPHHQGTEQAVTTAVMGAVQKGIHVYPVASSGVDGIAELTMRGAAQITGGRYIFLTDDSGIGNAHAEPHIPCYVVTPLQGALVRMIESEMKGQRVEPAATEILRTVGQPTDGKCALKDQSTVILY